jgi:menaquinone-9 beta-reductase
MPLTSAGLYVCPLTPRAVPYCKPNNRLVEEILIAGGGPAGAAAAIAARLEGAPVRVMERTRTPRHKVCGEFISPGAAGVLQALHAWSGFESLRPNRIERCVLHLGPRTKEWKLPEPGWGLSRLRLDALLLETAAAAGASIARGETYDPRRAGPASPRVVLARGRSAVSTPGNRLFGFKAHFEGPCDDAVELFFGRFGYAGVSGIEDGLTNVCAIAPEAALRSCAFDFDEILRGCAPLAARLKPLRRRMDWLAVGPVSFSAPLAATAARTYPAGDWLGFVDPFSGSGIFHALLTGRMAGVAAARAVAPEVYLRQCRGLLGRAYRVSSVLRALAARPEIHPLARLVPGELLFRLTRARGEIAV